MGVVLVATGNPRDSLTLSKKTRNLGGVPLSHLKKSQGVIMGPQQLLEHRNRQGGLYFPQPSVNLYQEHRTKTKKKNSQLFWELTRKVRSLPEWKPLLSLPQRSLSPAFLFQRSASMTAQFGRHGGPAFFSLNPPLLL